MAFTEPLSPEQREVALAARKAKKDAWAALDFSPAKVNEYYLKSLLSVAKARVGSLDEPATSKRVVQILRRVGVNGADIRQATFPMEAISIPEAIDKFIAMNTTDNKPMRLWHVAALLLELDGRFTGELFND